MPERHAACATCGECFAARARGPLPTQCPTCTAARKRDIVAAWRIAHPEKWRAQRQKANAKASEHIKAKSRAWRHGNVDRVRRYRRDLYEERQRAGNSAAVADYRRRNPGKAAEIQNRRRARLLDAFVEPVHPDALYARDGGLCGICHQPVERLLMTVDHVIPLARDGTHEMANVQTAHRSCNSRKGSRLVLA